ncbi:MAG: ABC transporter substrate-binding protein [Acidimicrobiia bacterium]
MPLVALAATVGLVAAACGGTSSDDGGGTASTEEEGTPQRGGEVTFGMEADTLGGFCVPINQWAISGIQVANAIYDTLTIPTDSGEYVPYLAKSVTPNGDFTEWTIELRPNIEFHNGEPLNADALKMNMDAWQNGILLSQVLEDVEQVTVVDDLTVRVTTTVPWPAYESALYGNGRFGIAAPEQIADTNSESCKNHPIGTGPFVFDEWIPNNRFVANANPDYWQTDENGEQLPYLDKITFVPIIEADQRVNALEQGRIQVMHTSNALATGRLEGLGDQANLLVQEEGDREVRYYILNSSEPPFDNPKAREAIALALDRNEINQVVNGGRFEIADQPFDTNTVGFEENPSFPEPDQERAAELVQEVKDEDGSFDVTLQTTPDPSNSSEAQLIKEQLDDVGINTDIRQVEQTSFISEVVAGNSSFALWRNLHGDPEFTDTGTTPWFTSDHIINFALYDDPEIDQLLEDGRSATDAGQREQIYTDLNNKLNQENYYIWGWYVDWAIGSKPNVNGLAGPTLPDGNQWLFLYGRVPVAGLWVS